MKASISSISPVSRSHSMTTTVVVPISTETPSPSLLSGLKPSGSFTSFFFRLAVVSTSGTVTIIPSSGTTAQASSYFSTPIPVLILTRHFRQVPLPPQFPSMFTPTLEAHSRTESSGLPTYSIFMGMNLMEIFSPSCFLLIFISQKSQPLGFPMHLMHPGSFSISWLSTKNSPAQLFCGIIIPLSLTFTPMASQSSIFSNSLVWPTNIPKYPGPNSSDNITSLSGNLFFISGIT